MNPIVSIVVPTKNRYKYLKLLISLIESFNDSRIELLVHDNSDDNAEIKKFLQGKSLLSTRYYYDPDKLSMCENAEVSIKQMVNIFVSLEMMMPYVVILRIVQNGCLLTR